MKPSSLPSRWALALAFCGVSASAVVAQDANPPYVAKPISDFTVSANAAPTVIKLKKTFALQGVIGELVRFSTPVGDIDVEMLTQNAPNTVATFLSYANTPGDNSSGGYTYNETLIQRAVPNFVVQGGGFYVDGSNQINQIINRPSIASEAGVKNARGTLAMALSSGPNSGTGDFFFNVKDNTNLDDNSNGGPFTVFGRVVGNMATLDGIEALPQQDFSGQLGGSFKNVPLVNYSGGQAGVENLLVLRSITELPLVAKSEGETAVLSLAVKSSNPALVTPTLKGQKLTLTYGAGQTGSAVITIKAKDAAKGKTKAKFTVTVQ